MIIDKEKLNEISGILTDKYKLLNVEAVCVLELVKCFYNDTRK